MAEPHKALSKLQRSTVEHSICCNNGNEQTFIAHVLLVVVTAGLFLHFFFSAFYKALSLAEGKKNKNHNQDNEKKKRKQKLSQKLQKYIEVCLNSIGQKSKKQKIKLASNKLTSNIFL